MKLRSTTKPLAAILLFAASVATMTGCTAQPIEGHGSSSSKLLAPHAMFKGEASAETKAALGISEWRIYRGKTEYVVTGYDSAGKAVKGVGLAFAGASSGARAMLKARLLDGTHLTARHEFGGATTASADLKGLSQSFVSHATHDLTALRMGLKTSITRSAVHTGEACGGDLVKIAMTSMQCIATAKSSGSTVSKIVKLKRCAAAAESASNAVESCQNAGTTTTPESPAKTTTPAKSTTPAKTTTPAKSGDKASEDDKESDSTDKTKSTDSTDKTTAADKKQDAEQDAEDAKKEEADKKQDAEQDAADTKQETADKAQDTQQDKTDDTQADADKAQDAQQDAADVQADANAGADATTASENQTCSSCSGTGADDVKADENTGAVSKADPSEDTGGSGGTDTGSGDVGGGDTGGGDTGGGDEPIEV